MRTLHDRLTEGFSALRDDPPPDPHTAERRPDPTLPDPRATAAPVPRPSCWRRAGGRWVPLGRR
jgi:hypothetical protein